MVQRLIVSSRTKHCNKRKNYGWVHWLRQETGVPEAICIIALNHARGNVLVARDFLESETARTRFIREAAEYGLLD